MIVLGGVSPEEAAHPSPELLMLVLVGGKGRGPGRSFANWPAQPGWRSQATGRQPSGRFVVECRPKAERSRSLDLGSDHSSSSCFFAFSISSIISGVTVG